KKAERRSAGHQLVQQREPLRPEFSVEPVEAGQVASRPIEARNKPKLRGVGGSGEHDWDAGGCGPSRASRNQPACSDTGHSKLDQISRQCWQSVSLVSRPAIFDRQVPAFNVTGLVQTSPEAGQPEGVGLR